MSIAKRLDRLEATMDMQVRPVPSPPLTLHGVITLPEDEALARCEPATRNLLLSSRQKLGLPVPASTPPRTVRRGVELARRALETNDFDEFHSWVNLQHSGRD